MFKKLSLIILVIGLLVPCAFVKAESTVSVNDVEKNDYFYGKTFDNLVMDFTINLDLADKLSALVIKRIGTARNYYEISGLSLWLDDGDGIFQGSGVDQLLRRSVYANGLWYFDNLTTTISEEKRFFVSVETEVDGEYNRTFNFVLPASLDNNKNGIFDMGDEGIFFESGLVLPIQELKSNIFGRYKRNGGNVSLPAIFFSNLKNGDVLKQTDFVIKGVANDRTDNAFKSLYICIDNDCSLVDNSLSNWQYEWTGITEGNHQIYIKSQDFLGGWYQTDTLNISTDFSKLAEVVIEETSEEIPVVTDDEVANNEVVREPIITVNEEYDSKVHNMNLMKRLAGRMLLRVGAGGAIGYVDPQNLHVYNVTWENARSLFEDLAIGISEADHNKIVMSGGSAASDFGKAHAGKLFLRVENGGAITYIDMNGFGHNVTWANLMPLFESVSLGISESDYTLIPKGVF